MTRKISTFIFIGLVLTIIMWMSDKSSVVTIDWREYHEVLSLPELMLWVLVFVLLIDVLNRFCRKIFKLQLKEVYKNAYFGIGEGENNAIDDLATRISEKIVMDRKDFDASLLLVLRTMTAITAGDMTEARYMLSSLKKVIGKDPIIDILTMKIYKGEKNYDKMEKLSAKIMKNNDLQIVGMKAAVEAQMEKKEFKTALSIANRAFELRQDLYWIIESAFELRAKAGDWEGALQVLEAGKSKKIIPADKYNRFRSIILFERAKEFKEKGDDVNFLKYCSQSVNADQTLVPAALALADYYRKDDNQLRKAEDILLNAWKKNPVDDVAYAYVDLYHKNDATGKIQDMERLALLNSIRPSLNNRLLAEFCAEAGLWKKAKAEIEQFLINSPCTKIACDFIANYEENYNKNKKEAQKWRKKCDDCADDSEWVCEECGKRTKKWHAICSKCQSLGAARWHMYVEKENKDVDFEDDEDEED